jgi:hypothetical protein
LCYPIIICYILIQKYFTYIYYSKIYKCYDKHYIAIKEDLSDLTDKIIEYKDLKKGEKIALEGKKFAKKYLTEKYLIKYLESKLKF